MKPIALLDTVYFYDAGTNGALTLRSGVVHALSSHEFAHGEYQVSCGDFQGLVSVPPKSIINVRKAVR